MEKFATLTRDRLSDSGRRKVMEMVENLDSVKNVAAWTAEIQRLFKRPVN